MYSDALNPFGMLEGQLVTVNDVSSGLACGCLCPACGAPLVARKGPKNVHHFSHAVKTDCKGALETALHLKAKDILSRFSQINLPPYYHPEKYHKPWIDHKPCIYYYSSALVEAKIGKIRPDVILNGIEAKPLIIEIFVTHAIDNQKAIEIKELGLPCLEIDLRYLKKLNLLDEKLIENGVVHAFHTKRWINNPNWVLAPTTENRQTILDKETLTYNFHGIMFRHPFGSDYQKEIETSLTGNQPRIEKERLGGQFLGMSQRAREKFGR